MQQGPANIRYITRDNNPVSSVRDMKLPVNDHAQGKVAVAGMFAKRRSPGPEQVLDVEDILCQELCEE